MINAIGTLMQCTVEEHIAAFDAIFSNQSECRFTTKNHSAELGRFSHLSIDIRWNPTISLLRLQYESDVRVHGREVATVRFYRIGQEMVVTDVLWRRHAMRRVIRDHVEECETRSEDARHSWIERCAFLIDPDIREELMGDLYSIRALDRKAGEPEWRINCHTLEELLNQLPQRIAHIRYVRLVWRYGKILLPIGLLSKLTGWAASVVEKFAGGG